MRWRGCLGATHGRVDPVEQTLRAAGGDRTDAGAARYQVAYAIAADKLTLGHTVIADPANGLEVTHNAWRDVARKAAVVSVGIEILCSDKTEHRLRAETRASDGPGLVKPSWKEIGDRRYEDWGTRPHRIDTATGGPGDIVAGLPATLNAIAIPAAG